MVDCGRFEELKCVRTKLLLVEKFMILRKKAWMLCVAFAKHLGVLHGCYSADQSKTRRTDEQYAGSFNEVFRRIGKYGILVYVFVICMRLLVVGMHFLLFTLIPTLALRI